MDNTNDDKDIVVDECTFDTKQAARFLCKSPRTLEGWRQQGLGPEYSKNGPGKYASVVYRKSHLIKYLERYTYNSTSEYPQNSKVK